MPFFARFKTGQLQAGDNTTESNEASSIGDGFFWTAPTTSTSSLL